MNSARTTGRRLRRTAAVVATGLLLSAALVACSSSSDTSTGSAKPAASTEADIQAALQKKSTITVWTWGGPIKDVAAAFMKKYPNVTVDVVNAGTGNDQYTKLQNAIKAGSGAPDVAQIEYFALPQFALSKSLVDLTSVGFDGLKDKFTASTWNSVNFDKALYGLPQDSGPMVMYYNKTVFDKFGLSVPTTWAEYTADAKKLHAADPSKFIAADPGDAGFTTSMIWQAGGKPFTTTNGTNVAINLKDDGAKKWTETWNPLVAGGLVAPIKGWSDEWYKALGDGTLATLLSGAWMPANFVSGVKESAGQWRVAPLPTYEAGKAATAENGGSSDAILKQSKNPLVAAGFLEYMNAGDGAQVSIDAGGFPSTTADLAKPAFLNAASAYFGGQQINQVLVQASKDVVPGWSYLPFQVYANSIFPDSVGQAYANKSDLNQGLAAWQDASASYGTKQGFTVTSK